MISQDALLAIVENKGPVLPADVKRETRTDLILTSAMLSNLVSAKKVKLTHLKVGSSPLYYVPGQEKDLVNYIEKLPEKVKRVVERLQQEGVLRESVLAPVERFGLQEAKDYAEALMVTVAGQREVFWKWYLLSDADAEGKIRDLLSPTSTSPEVKPAEAPEVKAVESVTPPKPRVVEPKTVEAPKPKLNVSAPASAEYKAPEVIPESKVEDKESKVEKKESKVEKKAETEKKEKKEEKKTEPKKESTVGKAIKAVQQLIRPSSEGINEAWQDDPFYIELMQFFAQNKIIVQEQDCIRKKSEYDFTIIIDSPVGALNYYCKAKSKKRLNEGDLSTIFLKAQNRKMPTLLLTNGQLTKKAEEMLASDLQGLTVKQL